MVQRDISQANNLEKLAREAKQLALEKRKQDGNPTIVSLLKRESSGLDQMTNQSSQKL